MNQYTPLINRFEASYAKDAETQCWVWTAAISRSNKWGDMRPRIMVGGKNKTAHRVSYELFVGVIPKGLWVLHKCDNSICVNPDHLYCGTPADNAHDMIAKGRATWQRDPKAAIERGRQLTQRKQDKRAREAALKLAEQPVTKDNEKLSPYLAFGRGFVGACDNYGEADAMVKRNGNGCVYVSEHIVDRIEERQLREDESAEHVAWCRYTHDESGGIETIETCDSDSPGAFKVYRHSPQNSPK